MRIRVTIKPLAKKGFKFKTSKDSEYVYTITEFKGDVVHVRWDTARGITNEGDLSIAYIEGLLKSGKIVEVK
jgi:hypothetical protein